MKSAVVVSMLSVAKAETSPWFDGVLNSMPSSCGDAWDLVREHGCFDPVDGCQGECQKHLSAVVSECQGENGGKEISFPAPHESISLPRLASQFVEFCAGNCNGFMNEVVDQCDPEEADPCGKGCDAALVALNETCGTLAWLSVQPGEELKQGTFWSTEAVKFTEMLDMMCDNPQCMQAMTTMSRCGGGEDMPMNMSMNMSKEDLVEMVMQRSDAELEELMMNMTTNMPGGMMNMSEEDMTNMPPAGRRMMNVSEVENMRMKLRSNLRGMSKQELMEMVQDMAPMDPMDRINKMCSDECQESYGVIASDACRPFSAMMGMDNESMGNQSMDPIEMLTSMCSDCFLKMMHVQPTCEDTGMDLCIPGTPCHEAVVHLRDVCGDERVPTADQTMTYKSMADGAMMACTPPIGGGGGSCTGFRRLTIPRSEATMYGARVCAEGDEGDGGDGFVN